MIISMFQNIKMHLKLSELSIPQQEIANRNALFFECLVLDVFS